MTAQSNDAKLSTANRDEVKGHAHLALTGDQIAKNVKDIRTAGAKLDKLIHTTGVALIVASMPQGEGGHLDMSKAIPFVDALPQGVRKQGVLAWLHAHSNIRMGTKRLDDGKLQTTARLLKPTMEVDGKSVPNPEYRPAQPLAANAKPFWAFTVEAQPVAPTFTTETLAARLEGIVKAYQNAKENGTVTLTPAEIRYMDKLAEDARRERERADQIKAKATGKPAPNRPVAKVSREEAARIGAAHNARTAGKGDAKAEANADAARLAS
jgi:hypothetical protein